MAHLSLYSAMFIVSHSTIRFRGRTPAGRCIAGEWRRLSSLGDPQSTGTYDGRIFFSEPLVKDHRTHDGVSLPLSLFPPVSRRFDHETADPRPFNRAVESSPSCKVGCPESSSSQIQAYLQIAIGTCKYFIIFSGWSRIPSAGTRNPLCRLGEASRAR